jgi:hypothetical protein
MLYALGASALPSAPAGLLGVADASASVPDGMTVSVGTSTLSHRVLLTVPVTVVCDALADPNTYADEVSVSVQQASGRTISSGSASLGGGHFFGGTELLTCDGATKNRLTISVLPASGSGPFHSGAAIFTISASHESGSCDPSCVFTGGEDAQIGQASFKIKGAG